MYPIYRPRYMLVKLLSIGVVTAVLVSACSSSGTSSASSQQSGTGKAAAAGSSANTIEVGVVCPLSGVQTYPGCTVATDAYFASINATGGVNGYKLKLVPCDNEYDETMAASCVSKLASDTSIMAFVGNNIDPTAEKTGMADIAPQVNTSEVWTNKDAFPVGAYSAGGADTSADLAYLKTKHIQRGGAIVCEDPGCVSGGDAIKAQLAKIGIPATVYTAPTTATNLTPQVVAAKADGVDALFPVEGSSGTLSVINAAATLDYKPYMPLVYSCYDNTFLSALPANTGNAFCTAPFKPYSTTTDPQMQSIMAKYGPSDWLSKDFTWSFVNAWVGAHLFVQALKTITGKVTRTSVISALRGITNFTSPWIAQPLNFSKYGPSATPAVRSTCEYLMSIHNGQLTQVQGSPFCTS
jgi:ABC-type branched-subunit amino acid transport system substrate-binding protein